MRKSLLLAVLVWEVVVIPVEDGRVVNVQVRACRGCGDAKARQPHLASFVVPFSPSHGLSRSTRSSSVRLAEYEISSSCAGTNAGGGGGKAQLRVRLCTRLCARCTGNKRKKEKKKERERERERKREKESGRGRGATRDGNSGGGCGGRAVRRAVEP